MAVIKVINSKASIGNAINYVTKKGKTEEHLVSGLGCSPKTAIDEMKATKELFGKNDGRQYKHYTQSFSLNDELTHEKAHEIGLEWAKKNFERYEVVVATHKDAKHIHNHFIVNSVSYEDGRKFQQSKWELDQLKKHSDKICEREGLSVIREPSAKVRYTQAEKEIISKGGTSWKDELRQVIDHEKKVSTSYEDLKKNLKNKYDIEISDTKKNGQPGKYITYMHPEHKSVRGSTLGLDYERSTLENEFNRQIESGKGKSTDGRTEQTTNDKRGTEVFGRANHRFERPSDINRQQDTRNVETENRGQSKDSRELQQDSKGNKYNVADDKQRFEGKTTRGTKTSKGTDRRDRGENTPGAEAVDRTVSTESGNELGRENQNSLEHSRNKYAVSSDRPDSNETDNVKTKKNKEIDEFER